VTDTLSVEIKGLDKLLAKLGKGATPVLRTLTRGIAEELKAELDVTPPKVKYPIVWASDKQRRWWFATHKGKMPYSRGQSGQLLNKSWTTEQRGEAGAAVGTRVTYAPWVQSGRQQQPMHANTGWVTDEQAVKKVNESGVVENMLRDILRKW